jgi:uncharacterized membrane protein affecting hemolysin expression
LLIVKRESFSFENEIMRYEEVIVFIILVGVVLYLIYISVRRFRRKKSTHAGDALGVI